MSRNTRLARRRFIYKIHTRDNDTLYLGTYTPTHVLTHVMRTHM